MPHLSNHNRGEKLGRDPSQVVFNQSLVVKKRILPGVDFLCFGSCSLERHEDCNWISCDEELDYQPNPYQPNMVLSVSVKDKREERGNTNAQQNHVQQLCGIRLLNDYLVTLYGHWTLDNGTCMDMHDASNSANSIMINGL